jgi:preprotein translocase subunit SecG
VAQGAIIIGTGGLSAPILAAVIIGGILLLDEILDDAGKKAVASLLTKTNSEDAETWFKRVCIVTSILSCVTSLALGAYTNTPQALKIASTATGVTLTCAQAGTEWGLNSKKADLTRIDFSWEESTRRFSDLLNDTKKQIEVANFVFEKNMELQQSLLHTAGQIMAR